MRDVSIRRLTIDMGERAGACVKLLLSQNIEVYEKTEEGTYRFAGETAVDGSVYVPEADYEHARKILCENGYEEALSNEVWKKAPMTNLEEIEESYYRKHKLHMIEWAVIIVAMIVYILFFR